MVTDILMQIKSIIILSALYETERYLRMKEAEKKYNEELQVKLMIGSN